MKHTDDSDWKAIVADDEAIIRLHLGQIVRKLGGMPVLVANGIEAVDACEQVQPAICFLDINMPGMDGIQAAQMIRAHAQVGARIAYLVAVSANKAAAEISKAFDECFDKPVRELDIANAVTHALSLIGSYHPETPTGSQVL